MPLLIVAIPRPAGQPPDIPSHGPRGIPDESAPPGPSGHVGTPIPRLIIRPASRPRPLRPHRVLRRGAAQGAATSAWSATSPRAPAVSPPESRTHARVVVDSSLPVGASAGGARLRRRNSAPPITACPVAWSDTSRAHRRHSQHGRGGNDSPPGSRPACRVARSRPRLLVWWREPGHVSRHHGTHGQERPGA